MAVQEGGVGTETTAEKKEEEIELLHRQSELRIHKERIIEIMCHRDELRVTMLKQKDEDISALKGHAFHIQDVNRLREDIANLREEVDNNDFGRRRREDELHSFTAVGDNYNLKRAQRIEKNLNLESPSP